MLNLKLLDEKYQSISKEDSKGNKIKIPAEKSKTYIIFLINVCNTLGIFLDKIDKNFYKILIFLIISRFMVFHIDIDIGKVTTVKTFLSIIYNKDTLMLKFINKLTLKQILSASFIGLINLYTKYIIKKNNDSQLSK